MQEFNLIVIGSGSGLDVANAAVQHGMHVAIVEKGRMGGTCLNRSCIPSKLLIHSANVGETIKSAKQFGINVYGFAKFLVSKEGRILGCHIIGSHASVLIHEALVAMKIGAGIGSIATPVHIHPALSEVVSRAASYVE